MEYNAVLEFNKIRNKPFIPFAAFSKLYREAIADDKTAHNKVSDLIKKLLDGTEEKTSLIIVSGIPGSGKGRLANQMARQLQ